MREWFAETVTTNEVKTLDVDVEIFREGGRQIGSAENGMTVEWDGADELPRVMYDNSWNTLRLTVRGVDRADESLRALVRSMGMVIFIR